jgi:hypothetical protein
MDGTTRARSAGLLLLALVLLPGCSSTMTIDDRPGATSAQSNSDHQRCHEMVEAQPGLYVPPQATLAGAAGAGAIAGAAGVIAEERAVDVCMQRLGYTKRTLTPQETQAVRAAPRGPAREKALDALMKANDPVSEQPMPPAG